MLQSNMTCLEQGLIILWTLCLSAFNTNYKKTVGFIKQDGSCYLLALNKCRYELAQGTQNPTRTSACHTRVHVHTKQWSTEKKIISNISRAQSNISIFNFKSFPKHPAPINNLTDATKLSAYNRTTEQKRSKHNTIKTHPNCNKPS